MNYSTGRLPKDFHPILRNKLLVQRDQIERYKERLKKQRKSTAKQAASPKKSLPSLEEQYNALTDKLRASRFLSELREKRKEAKQQLKKWKRVQAELDQLIRQRKIAEHELAKWSKIWNDVSRFIERITDVNARRN